MAACPASASSVHASSAFQGVYRVRPGRQGGEPELLVDRYLFGQPNGLCFSPDERLLYINDTEKAVIRVFDVQPDGSLANSRLFAEGIKDDLKAGVPDGMKCDAEGNVWVTAPGGLWVYAPDGRHIGKVDIPELAANLHWGGEDWRTLFVCATHSVYSIQTIVGPRNEPFMIGTADRRLRLRRRLAMEASDQTRRQPLSKPPAQSSNPAAGRRCLSILRGRR